MGRIRLLADEVASQVAAGEVVERPASVLKELVENSLDAGARRIEAAIARGGAALVRVTDDGSGMDRDDALLCLERHATSKIRTGQDLATVRTLGFRGEALPSIASVSRFRLATRERESVEGTEILVSGGKIQAVREAGLAPGTVIEARSLFFNLPARRKFLRSEPTESGQCEHQLQLLALGHPEVAFTFVRDERPLFQLAAAPDLGTRVRDLAGPDLFRELLPLEAEPGGLRLHGFIGKPGVARSNRAQMHCFVNGRAVENVTLSQALREGYHTALMKGQYPVVFLFLELDPLLVDVNVHPAKREVRFRDPAMVREAIVGAVRDTLSANRESWRQTFSPAVPSGPLGGSPGTAPAAILPGAAPAPPPAAQQQLFPAAEQHALRRDWWQAPSAAPATASPEAAASTPAAAANPPPAEAPAQPAASATVDPPAASPDAPRAQDFQVIGALGDLYILMENRDGLVLVDQHAAHERILFEQLRRRMESHGVPGQRLLISPTIQLPPRDADWVRNHREELARMGIGLEEFGGGTFKLETLPEFLVGREPAQLLREIIDELMAAGASASKLRMGEDLIATTVCRHAVKARDRLRQAEVVKLVEDLLACDLPYCCPHGRPTMIQIGYRELERKFGRVV